MPMEITNSCFRPGLDTDTYTVLNLHNATETVTSFTSGPAVWVRNSSSAQ